ncbi:hypothetical protein ACFFU9_00290 [Mariniflexile ostreae]|uniref:Uncharacterized protein n=1 Tax=Mariniflexile ostreae TaxID=1520892 RepID=A0ABV5F6U4_9FLAO
MKTNILYLIFLMGSFTTVVAQNVNFTGWSNNYMTVGSYSGQTSSNANTFVFSGNTLFNYPNWKLSVKLKNTITSNGYVFPANKVSFQPASSQSTTGSPTMAEIGMPIHVVLQEQQEMFLVPNANAPLRNEGSYYALELRYNLTIEGGAYLAQYPAYIEFPIPLQFTAYDKNNNILGKVDVNYKVQISRLTGTPPETPQLSIKLDANAANGLLELKTIKDYTQGTQVTYTNGLSINANTNYQIQVKSLQSNFISSAGNTLPLNTVKLLLSPSAGNTGVVFPISISENLQKTASGEATQGVPTKFSITYRSNPNDVNLINATMDNYTTTLQYVITPL